MGEIAPAIFGCAGLTLTEEERAFFERVRPLGFILFARNVETPDQVCALTGALRDCVPHDAPILIDQEGGRVQRLRPPHWRNAPAARTFGDLYTRDEAAGLRAIRLNHILIGAELRGVGVDTDCVPCLDVPVPGAHGIIGDRAFSEDPTIVAACGRAAWEGLAEAGVLPIGKHMPGHGRAASDSHHDLPRVATDLQTLIRTDFWPFKQLADIPLGMTAHIVFDALDADRPVTQSPDAVRFLRDDIGFDGLLMTDDLSMKALDGDFGQRTRACLDAGCDVVLHCNGDMAEMTAVAEALSPMSDAALRRWQAAEGARRKTGAFDLDAAREELEDLVPSAGA